MTDANRSRRSRRTEPRRSRHIQAAPSGPEAKQIGSRTGRGVLAAVSALALGVMSMGYFTVGNLSNDLAQANNLNLGQQKTAPRTFCWSVWIPARMPRAIR